jgi:plasmid maintenance system antidote protein VapI
VRRIHYIVVNALTCEIAAAERRELYRFSADLGKLALRLADQYGSSHEKWLAFTAALISQMPSHVQSSQSLVSIVLSARVRI